MSTLPKSKISVPSGIISGIAAYQDSVKPDLHSSMPLKSQQLPLKASSEELSHNPSKTQTKPIMSTKMHGLFQNQVRPTSSTPKGALNHPKAQMKASQLLQQSRSVTRIESASNEHQLYQTLGPSHYSRGPLDGNGLSKRPPSVNGIHKSQPLQSPSTLNMHQREKATISKTLKIKKIGGTTLQSKKPEEAKLIQKTMQLSAKRIDDPQTSKLKIKKEEGRRVESETLPSSDYYQTTKPAEKAMQQIGTPVGQSPVRNLQRPYLGSMQNLHTTEKPIMGSTKKTLQKPISSSFNSYSAQNQKLKDHHRRKSLSQSSNNSITKTDKPPTRKMRDSRQTASYTSLSEHHIQRASPATMTYFNQQSDRARPANQAPPHYHSTNFQPPTSMKDTRQMTKSLSSLGNPKRPASSIQHAPVNLQVQITKQPLAPSEQRNLRSNSQKPPSSGLQQTMNEKMSRASLTSQERLIQQAHQEELNLDQNIAQNKRMVLESKKPQLKTKTQGSPLRSRQSVPSVKPDIKPKVGPKIQLAKEEQKKLERFKLKKASMSSFQELKKSPIQTTTAFVKPPAESDVSNLVQMLTDMAGKYKGSKFEANFHQAVSLIEGAPNTNQTARSTLDKARLASQREYNIITSVDEGGSLSSQRLLDFQPGTGGSKQKGAPSSQSTSEKMAGFSEREDGSKEGEKSERQPDRVIINLKAASTNQVKSAKTKPNEAIESSSPEPKEPSDLVRMVGEGSKKIQGLESKLKEKEDTLAEKEKQILRLEKLLLNSNEQTKLQNQELTEVKKHESQLEQQLAQEKRLRVRKVTASVSTEAKLLTEKELDSLVEVAQLARKLKKTEKEKQQNANKISKFIYFFFTLQNRGIPVNDIYESDGVKQIKTERFQEMMNPQEEEQKKSERDDFSFYSDDSYDYVPHSEQLVQVSKFKNINKLIIPLLELNGLPAYETTEEDEEEEEEQVPQSQEQIVDRLANINSPLPHEVNEPIHQGPKKERRVDTQYADRLNEDAGWQGQQPDWKCQMQDPNDSRMMFDDAPKSITEDSMLEHVDENILQTKHHQLVSGSGVPREIVHPHKFDQSERFDESVVSPNPNGRDILEVMGMSIDSKSLNASMLEEHHRRSKIKKQKEDLDGSKIFREGPDSSQEGKPSRKKKQVSQKKKK